MSEKERNKYGRIAYNTLILYGRMLLTMGISFYTTRITLEALGVDDYGIYNVLGGVVALCSILTGAMTVSISRFYTLELGKGDYEKMRDVFSASLMVMTGLAVLIGIIAEVGALWFIDDLMSIPPDRVGQARIAVQCFIFSFMLGIISVPYNSAVIGHEKMAVFAYVTIVNSLLKLGIAFALFLASTDRLVIYSILMMMVEVLNRLIYGIYCNRNFPETKFRRKIKKNILKEMGSFTGWTFLGNAAVTVKEQGSNLIMNVFCGLIVNAARGIAVQVSGAIDSLVNNFMMAVNPQIYKAYSLREIGYMHTLIVKSAKFGYFIMFAVAFPICVNIKYVLGLWLTEVPEFTGSFVILSIIYSLIQCLCSPLITGVLASGKIRNYELEITFGYLLNFGCSFFALRAGWSPNWVLIFNIIFKLIILFILLYHSKITFSLGYKTYIYRVITPIAVISSICVLGWLVIGSPISGTFKQFIIQTICFFLFSILMIYLCGMTRGERGLINRKIMALVGIKGQAT